MAGLKGLADKAKQFLSKNPDKARQGIDRASQFADEKTGGKYSDKIDKGTDRAKDYLAGGQGEPPEGQQPRGGEQGRQGQQGQQGKHGRQDQQGQEDQRGQQGQRPPQ